MLSTGTLRHVITKYRKQHANQWKPIQKTNVVPMYTSVGSQSLPMKLHTKSIQHKPSHRSYDYRRTYAHQRWTQGAPLQNNESQVQPTGSITIKTHATTNANIMLSRQPKPWRQNAPSHLCAVAYLSLGTYSHLAARLLALENPKHEHVIQWANNHLRSHGTPYEIHTATAITRDQNKPQQQLPQNPFISDASSSQHFANKATQTECKPM